MIWLLPARSIERADRTWASGCIPHSISLGDVMSTELEQLDSIDFSGFLDGCHARWCCFLSPSSPLEGRSEKGRNSYAPWLRSKEAAQRGLYIWLHELPDGAPPAEARYRFVHVGLAKKGASTLASRTRVHCQNAFSKDPTYELRDHENGFGRLIRVRPRDQPGVDQEHAEQFLRQIHVLLLIPPKPDPCAIAQMEGLIAYAAAGALHEDQITNTMGHVQPPPEKTKLAELVKRLNDVVPMLPE